MQTSLPYLRRRMALRMQRRGTSIRLDWVTLANVQEDPTTSAKLGTATPQTETVNGFFNYMNIAHSNVRQFEEIEDGDAIIDIPANIVIEGREGLAFTIDGQVWVQKRVGEKLAQHWEVHQGQRLYRTLLLRKQT